MTQRPAARAARDPSARDEIAALRARLAEVEEILSAFQHGDVDAVVRPGAAGPQIFTLKGADHAYREMVEAMSEGAVTLSPEGEVLYCNQRFADLVGHALEQVIGSALSRFSAAADGAAIAALLQRAQAAAAREPLTLQRADGAQVPVYLALRSLAERGVPAIVGVVTDLSELRRAEEALRRAYRHQTTVSAINQMLVKAQDETALLQDACRLLIETGGYRLAWIGLADDAPGKPVRPVAHAGADGDYLRAATITWADEPRGRGPTGRAIRERVPQVIRFIPTDPAMAPWREEATRHGYASSAALPLIVGQTVFGVLNMYAAQVDAFDEGETRLLNEMAADIAFAMQALRDREQVLSSAAALGRANARLRGFIDANIVGVLITRADGAIVEANDYYLQMVGYSRAELEQGKVDWRALTPPEWRVADEEALRQLHATGRCNPYEKEYLLRDGRRVAVLLVDALLPGPDEEIAASALDISEQKRVLQALRLSEDKFRRSFEYASIGKSLTRPDGRLDTVNAAFCRMLGYTQEELAARTAAEITHPEDRAATAECIRCLLAGERDSYRLEKRYLRKDGTVVWADVSSMLLRDDMGAPLHFVTHIVDISERRAAEQEVRRLNAELEQRVAQRTAELQAANKDLEGFAYSVSHDLRAPLRAVDSFSKIVLDDYAGQLDAEGQRLLGTVRRNAETMGRLIDDILAFSRAGRKELNRVDIDVAALAREVFAELLPAAGDRRIELRVGELPHAQGDRAVLRQVLVNLLSNAIKFTAPRDAASIEVSGAAAGAQVEFAVRDNGVGFDPAYAHKLFGVFQRLHTADEFPGTGIGLAIVKRVIEKHGGRVWAEGQPGKGATFHIALPTAAPAAA